MINFRIDPERQIQKKRLIGWPTMVFVGFLLVTGVIFTYFERKGFFEEYFERSIPQTGDLSKMKREYKNYKIGFITDIHAERSKKYQGDFSPKSKKALEEFVLQMNERFHPDFVVEGGDFIEGTKRVGQESIDDFLKLDEIYKQTNAPAYHVLGNHELRGFDKQKWLELTGNKNTYYYFDYDRLRIIVLDGNYISVDNNLVDVSPETDHYIRGRISEEQLVWLEKVLEEGRTKRQIIFVHQPPLEETKYKDRNQVLNGGSTIRELAAKYRARAVFSGHIEEAYHKKIDGVDYFVLPGAHKSNDEKMDDGDAYKRVYAEIESGRNLKVTMYYMNMKTAQYESLVLSDT